MPLHRARTSRLELGGAQTFHPSFGTLLHDAGSAGRFVTLTPPHVPLPVFGNVSVHCVSGPGGGGPGYPGKLQFWIPPWVTSIGGVIAPPAPPHAAEAVDETVPEELIPRTGRK